MEEIRNEKTKNTILFLVNNLINNNGVFPLSNSVDLEKKHFEKLNRYDYRFIIKNTVSHKRGCLFLYKDSENLNKSVIIFKDLSVFSLNLNVYEEYYMGTLLDVSIIENDTIILYDTIIEGGILTRFYSYDDRLSCLELFNRNIIESYYKILLPTVYNKSFDISNYNLNNEEELFMIPNDVPLFSGVNFNSFKWRPSQDLYFSLKVDDKEDVIDLYTTIFRRMKLFATIDKKIGHESVKDLENLENYSTDCIVDFNIQNNKIIPLRVNLDKELPSNLRSIERILSVKKENINLSEIFV